MASVSENLKKLRGELEAIRPGTVIVGAAKAQAPERVKEAIEAGLTVLGDNYLQQGEALRTELGPIAEKVEWHFIGHLQSRKAKSLSGYRCVQSLERKEVAEILDRSMEVIGRKMSVLVEVNIGKEPQKSGVLPEKLENFLTDLSRFKNLELSGLMAMPPALQPVENRRPFFEEMRGLFEANAKRFPFKHLSMGTSEDYLVAARYGATMVRLGTLIFGERPK